MSRYPHMTVTAVGGLLDTIADELRQRTTRGGFADDVEARELADELDRVSEELDDIAAQMRNAEPDDHSPEPTDY